MLGLFWYNLVSRDGSAKKYTNKGSYGRDKVHPYTLFSSNRVSMKKNVAIGMHLVPTIATLVCIILFARHYHPYLLL